MSWVQLINGGRFSFDGKHEWLGFDRFDAGKALSQINRFTGHTTEPWNVAAHSLLVSELAGREAGDRAALLGLVHDLHEIVIGDISTPVKNYISSEGGGSALARLENMAQRALCDQLGVSLKMTDVEHQAVKKADLVALMTEKRDLMVNSFEWDCKEPPSDLRCFTRHADAWAVEWSDKLRHLCRGTAASKYIWQGSMV